MKITNLKELEERGGLQHEDVVIFTIEEETIEYKVCITHLWDRRWGENNVKNNNKIFNILEIDKNEITEEAYGYSPVNYSDSIRYFPEYRCEDYSAVTRLVKKLYKIAEKKYLPEETIITTRFELMEL